MTLLANEVALIGAEAARSLFITLGDKAKSINGQMSFMVIRRLPSAQCSWTASKKIFRVVRVKLIHIIKIKVA